MYLKEIEIHGFKSFADKTNIQFKEGITAIVGPNGSGKSNIIDAIRWALGEQSSKSLRGNKMEDVIFLGTKNRKPLGRAEVILIFDNASGLIPIEYEEVSIRRRLFRSGESEYSINNNICRLKDIRELFMDTGVGTDGYSIIGQGQIDVILSNKPEERRYIFEEAAGITKYRVKKEESQRKLKRTEDNLTRIEDILSELNKQYRSLKRDARKTEEYNFLSEKKNNIELELLLKKLKNNIYIIKSLKNERYKILDKINQLESKLRDISSNKVKLASENLFIKKEFDKIEKSLLEYKTLKSDLDNKINLLNESNKYISMELDRLEEDLLNFISRTKAIDGEIILLEKQVEEYSRDYKRLESNYSATNNKLQITSEKLAEKSKILEEKREESLNLYRASKDKESDLLNIENFIKNLANQIESQNNILEDANNKFKSLDLKEIDLKDKKELLVNEISILEKSKSELESAIINKEEALENIFSQIKELESELNYKSSQLNSFLSMEENYDGYYRSVKELMLASKKNSLLEKSINGVVGDLIKVDKEYAKAIEVALGSKLQNIVTPDQKSAQVLISYLKKNKLGRATFLPINIIKGWKINTEKVTSQEDGYLGIACELISYDVKYKNILENLLGTTIIVDNLENGTRIANKINYRFKIVSLDGDVINPGGAITGGSISIKNSNLLNRKNQIVNLEKNIVALKKELKNLNLRKEKLEEEKIHSYKELEIKGENLKKLDFKKYRLEEDLKITLEQKDNITFNIEDLHKDIEYFNKNNKKYQKEIEEIKKNKDSIDGNLKTLKDYINSLIIELRKLEASKIHLSDRVLEARLDLKAKEEELKYSKETLKKLADEKNSLLEKIKTNDEAIRTNKLKLEKTNMDISITKEKIRGIEKETVLYETKKIDLNKKIENQDKNLKKLEDREKFLEKEVSDLTSRINQLDMDLAREQVYSENYKQDLKNYTKIKRVNTNINSYAFSEKNRLEEELEKLELDIDKLGTVNLNAIIEFKEVEERLEFYEKQVKDLEKSKEDLKNIILEMEEKMGLNFKFTLNKINTNFKKVFSDLFGGGKADIILQDEGNLLESGIEIKAQPPGRKFQSLSLLSGGEKSLTAVALLFSIFMLKSTPFCILDEIDASLDDANIDRYINYLTNFSTGTQFIMITHRRSTMESADVLYGITMEEEGVSKTISIDLNDIGN